MSDINRDPHIPEYYIRKGDAPSNNDLLWTLTRLPKLVVIRGKNYLRTDKTYVDPLPRCAETDEEREGPPLEERTYTVYEYCHKRKDAIRAVCEMTHPEMYVEDDVDRLLKKHSSKEYKRKRMREKRRTPSRRRNRR